MCLLVLIEMPCKGHMDDDLAAASDPNGPNVPELSHTS
jgi:hypothetical protein